MLFFLSAETMFFAGLISAFFVLRLSAAVWPPPLQPRLPVLVTGLNTLVLLASSVAMIAALRAAGIDPQGLPALAALTLVGSNTIGNVPTVVLLLAVQGDLPASALHALAALSTLAGNLLIVGSLANIIVVERASQCGITLGFGEHARCGVPMTLLSFAAALAWFAWRS